MEACGSRYVKRGEKKEEEAEAEEAKEELFLLRLSSYENGAKERDNTGERKRRAAAGGRQI